MPVFPGYDIAGPSPELVVDLWAVSNLYFCGFYLSHSPRPTGATRWVSLSGSTSPPHSNVGLWVARDCGWRLLPVYLSFQEWLTIRGDPARRQGLPAEGRVHGQTAARLAVAAHLERGATVYLDLENPILGNQPDEFSDYVTEWCRALTREGYRPGVYCSRLDAPRISRIVGTQIPDLVLWPFSIRGRTTPAGPVWFARRVGAQGNEFVWDPQRTIRTRTIPVDPREWSIENDPQWGMTPSVVGCQHDFWNPQNAEVQGFQWPRAAVCRTPRPGAGLSALLHVDWDSSKVPDPAHPRADLALAVCADPAGSGRLFVVESKAVCVSERPNNAASWSPLQRVTTIDDLWPPPSAPATPAWDRGLEPLHAAAASRQEGHFDLFLVGVDGSVRTTWANPGERYIRHPWDINWTEPASGNRPARRLPARQGSPVAAVCDVPGWLDVFYVSDEHRVVHRWWRPGPAAGWAEGSHVDPRPAGTEEQDPTQQCARVAPASNLVVLADRGPQPQTGRIHLLWVGFPFDGYPNGRDITAWWNRFRVWHAIADLPQNASPRWTSLGVVADSQGTAASAAAATGIAAAIGPGRRIHLVTQNPNRSGLAHWIRERDVWTHSDLPLRPPPRTINPPIPPRDARTMALVVIGKPDEVRLLLVLVDAEQVVLWTTYDGRTWSPAQEWIPGPSEAPFSAGRPIRLRPYASGNVEVIGVTEDRKVIVLTLRPDAGGGYTPRPPSYLAIP